MDSVTIYDITSELNKDWHFKLDTLVIHIMNKSSETLKCILRVIFKVTVFVSFHNQ